MRDFAKDVRVLQREGRVREGLHGASG
jgi:hypothetical protein